MSTEHAARTPAARVAAWMEAWDGAVRALLAERPDGSPGAARPFSPAGIALAAAMLGACVAVVARTGPHPFVLVMFVAFGALYLAIVPAPLLLRPLGVGVGAEEAADLQEAAARARAAWQEAASRAVAAWHLAREASLDRLGRLGPGDGDAAAAAARIRALVAPPPPRAGVDAGPLRGPASTPLADIPSLEGWGGVAGTVVVLARRRPFTLAEVFAIAAGMIAVPPAVFLAIDGAAAAVACAVLPPDACEQPDAGRDLFLLGMISITGVVILWRLATRARVACQACGTLVTLPRLAPRARCHGCGRRVWVQWRK